VLHRSSGSPSSRCSSSRRHERSGGCASGPAELPSVPPTWSRKSARPPRFGLSSPRSLPRCRRAPSRLRVSGRCRGPNRSIAEPWPRRRPALRPRESRATRLPERSPERSPRDPSRSPRPEHRRPRFPRLQALPHRPEPRRPQGLPRPSQVRRLPAIRRRRRPRPALRPRPDPSRSPGRSPRRLLLHRRPRPEGPPPHRPPRPLPPPPMALPLLSRDRRLPRPPLHRRRRLPLLGRREPRRPRPAPAPPPRGQPPTLRNGPRCHPRRAHPGAPRRAPTPAPHWPVRRLRRQQADLHVVAAATESSLPKSD